ncbi:hypothetical protein Tdes44962_MAKER03142 [Teratosphaeria destructans]|uniref:Uncharacterized protein n=1 Tax=Teratosphaeria destructans TaxID=418781 RepID=A0A9W7W247_9PEZI|nr:hypothetical protein Tdes44962_MAKER03142 [Teratosphaeria destructans]
MARWTWACWLQLGGFFAICMTGGLLLGKRYSDCLCTIPAISVSPVFTHPPPPAAHLPPSVSPFIDRIAYQLPDRLLPWTDTRPVHPARRNKRAKWVDDDLKEVRPAAALLNELALDAWAGEESMTRNGPLGRWITQWVLHTDKVDRLAREEHRTTKEAMAEQADTWWSWASLNAVLLEKSMRVKAAAAFQQESLLERVSDLVAEESSALTREVVQPALDNETSWFWPSSFLCSRARRLNHTLGSLRQLNVPSTIKHRSWSNPEHGDDTGRGRGEVFYISSPRTVMGRQIPSNTSKAELDIHMHDFVDALVIEMMADAVIALIETYEAVCAQERARGYDTIFTHLPNPEVDDFSLPELHSRVLRHLEEMPRPFTALKDDLLVTDNEHAKRTDATLRYLLGTLDKPPSNRKGKVTPQLAFWTRVVRDTACVFMDRKKVDLAIIQDSLGDEAAEAVWHYWQKGVDVRWRTTATSKSYIDQAMGFAFDLGGTPVTETKVCRVLLEG